MTIRRALNHLAEPSSSPPGLSRDSPIGLKYQTLGHNVISAWPNCGRSAVMHKRQQRRRQPQVAFNANVSRLRRTLPGRSVEELSSMSVDDWQLGKIGRRVVGDAEDKEGSVVARRDTLAAVMVCGSHNLVRDVAGGVFRRNTR
jgi:hypothetical protein